LAVMARPQKQRMDWFPCETVFNDSFKALEELHGNDGFVWIVKFWQKAYRNGGSVNLSDIHGVIVAKTARIPYDKHVDILNDCVKLGLLYQQEDKTYTSEGIQNRLIKRNSKREYDRNLHKNELSLRKQCDNHMESTQSRVEKSREDKKEEDTPADAVLPDSSEEDISSIFAGEVSLEFLDEIKNKPQKELSLHAIITRRFSEAYSEVMGCKYREQKIDSKHLKSFLENNPDMTEDLFFKVVNKAKEDKFYRKNLTVRFICNNFSKIESSEPNE